MNPNPAGAGMHRADKAAKIAAEPEPRRPPLADYLSPKIILTGDKEKWHEKASKI